MQDRGSGSTKQTLGEDLLNVYLCDYLKLLFNEASMCKQSASATNYFNDEVVRKYPYSPLKHRKEKCH